MCLTNDTARVIRSGCAFEGALVSVTISGNRVTLRDWREDDLDPWRHWMHPERRWHELDGPYYSRPDARQIGEMIEKKRDAISADEWPVPRHSLVIAEGAANKLLGVVTWSWESQETHWITLGIVIFDSARWGQGIGYESLGLWSQYLFDSLPRLVRLDLRTWSGNHGMIRLAGKLGYTLEARFRMARIVNGVHFDGLGYGVLRSEWEQRYPEAFAQGIATT